MLLDPKPGKEKRLITRTPRPRAPHADADRRGNGLRFRSSLNSPILTLGTCEAHGIANDGGKWKRNRIASTFATQNLVQKLISFDVNSGWMVDSTIAWNGKGPNRCCVGHSTIPKLRQGIRNVELDLTTLFRY